MDTYISIVSIWDGIYTVKHINNNHLWDKPKVALYIVAYRQVDIYIDRLTDNAPVNQLHIHSHVYSDIHNWVDDSGILMDISIYI